MILDGKMVADLRNEELRKKIIAENLKLTTAIILVGSNPASLVYVKNKIKASKKVGINTKLFNLDETISDAELTKVITNLNNDNEIDGILLQLPLPKHLDDDKFINLINPLKDIDGFTTINQGRLFQKQPTIVSATPQGIINLLNHYKVDVTGLDAVVIGRSQIVGMPIAKLLTDLNATVTVCHTKTKDLSKYTKKADLIVAAVGVPKMITANMVKDGVVIIDVGINRLNGKLVGDVDFEEVSKKAKYITPVPKGVGPMTINALLENIYKIKRGV